MKMEYEIKGTDGKWRGCNFHAVNWMLQTYKTAKFAPLEYRINK